MLRDIKKLISDSPILDSEFFIENDYRFER